jgi:hypothetical protein
LDQRKEVVLSDFVCFLVIVEENFLGLYLSVGYDSNGSYLTSAKVLLLYLVLPRQNLVDRSIAA